MDSANGMTNIYTNGESAHTSKSHNYTLNFRSTHPCDHCEDSIEDEPPLTQHLWLDFTPDKEIDNDFAQKKCCKFWDFINNVPGLQNLMVMPEKIKPPESESPSVITVMGTGEISGEVEPKGKNTLSVLKFIEDEGIFLQFVGTLVDDTYITEKFSLDDIQLSKIGPEPVK